MFCRWVGVSITALGLLTGYLKKVASSSSIYSESQIRSPTLILGHLPYSMSLSSPGDNTPTPHPHQLQISFHFHGQLAISPVLLCTCPEPPLTPHSLSLLLPSLHLPFITILFPLLSEIQASSLGPPFLFSFFVSVECNMEPIYNG